MAGGSQDNRGDQRGKRPSGPEPPGRKLKGPFVAYCEPGKYAWCRCGKSARYPYCDGTHRDSDVTPVKVVVEEAKTLVWCACGATNNPPFCDGSHGRL
ncbi:MAG: CDGSH iron-sulfur domain-containing protein [Planctomycetota bacterium]|nr:CDGSH iron-sulfur domain-containing protein [Planctomycetota bacterium]